MYFPAVIERIQLFDPRQGILRWLVGVDTWNRATEEVTLCEKANSYP